MEAWISIGEGAAAEHFRKYLLDKDGNVLWQYARVMDAQGPPGVYPTGNPNESMNKEIKHQVAPTNRSKLSFFKDTLPKLFQFISMNKSEFDPFVANDVPPTTICGILRRVYTNIDVFKKEPGVFLVNNGPFTGVEITPRRVELYNIAMAGDVEQLHILGEDVSPHHRLGRLVKYQCQFCEVTKTTTGDIWCRCINFRKRGQCPATLLIRDEYKTDPISTERALCLLPKRKRGTKRQAKLNGLNRGLPSLPSAKDLTLAICSLTRKQMHRVRQQLRVGSLPKDGEGEAEWKKRMSVAIVELRDNGRKDNPNSLYVKLLDDDDDGENTKKVAAKKRRARRDSQTVSTEDDDSDDGWDIDYGKSFVHDRLKDALTL